LKITIVGKNLRGDWPELAGRGKWVVFGLLMGHDSGKKPFVLQEGVRKWKASTTRKQKKKLPFICRESGGFVI